MKVYRVFPDIFVTDEMLDTTKNIVIEALYYKMGFTAFSTTQKYGQNNLKCRGKQGKYFFLFMEDAITEGYRLINNFHKLRTNSFLIIEYDIPLDLIFKHLGYGDYTTGFIPHFLTESFIEVKEFGECVQVDKNIIKKELLMEFIESLKRIKSLSEYNFDELQYYNNAFWKNILTDNITDDEAKFVLERSSLFYYFLNSECNIRLSPFATNKMIAINSKHDLRDLTTLSIRCKMLI